MRAMKPLEILRMFFVIGACALGSGCQGRGARLAAGLPPAPSGWSIAKAASGEDVSGAGSKATVSYVPSAGAAKGVAAVDVFVYEYDAHADGKARSHLRKYPFDVDGFFETEKVAGLEAQELI